MDRDYERLALEIDLMIAKHGLIASRIFLVIFVAGIALLETGCAPSVSSGVKTVNRGLVEIDQALERDTKAAGAQMIAQIDKCKAQDLKTEKERKQCLGKWAAPVPVEEYKKIRDAYDRIYFDAREIETRNLRVNQWMTDEGKE